MPAKPPPDKVTFTLDGRQVEATKGEMIIAAAERAGVYIPRFCYHPRMKPVGMCRMCLIELKGPRGVALTPACFVAVADGQEIFTTTPAVKKAQDGVLEFLLVNHPLDCPVCDKGGECPLQDQTLAYGPGETRFVEEKRHWAKPIALSELVLLDRERCIQCARCTRFADEVAGDAQIDFAMRGDMVEVATFPGRPFTSYFSGNTVQICPVGALTSTPYRFKARPWDIEQVESSCVSCAVGCRVAMQSSGDRIIRYIGVDSEPINQSWLCDKGRFDFEAVNSDERLSAPMIRKGDELVEVGWSEALEAVGTALAQARTVRGGPAIGVIGGARLSNEDAYVWSKLARSVLGTDNVDAQLGDGLPAEAVLGLPRATIDQACQASAVILLGPDLKDELPILYLRLRAAVLSDELPIVELAEQSSGLTPYAAVTLLYRPGEAAPLARALVAAEDPVADVAGVAAGDIAAARRVLAQALADKGADADLVVVLGRPSMADTGVAVAEAAAVLASSGPAGGGGGAPGGVRFLSALRRSNVHGALDMGLSPGILPGRVTLEAGRSWFGRAWGSLPESPGMGTAAMLTEASEGRLAALVLLGSDPLADFPDRTLAKRGLDGAGFVVAIDCFVTGSARQADVLLPAATYAERGGTFTNLEGRVLRLAQKVIPPGQAWPDWMIAAELALRLDGDLGFDNLEQVWDEIERLSPAHAGVTSSLLDSHDAKDGVVVPLGGTGHQTAPPARLDPMAEPGIIGAESHWTSRLTISSPEAPFVGEAEHGPIGNVGEADPERAAATAASDAPAEPPAPTDGPPPPLTFALDGPAGPVPPLDGYSLRLIASRRLWDAGTLVQHSPHLAGLGDAPVLRINPHDLERLGLRNGGRVKVGSAHGSLVMDVTADTGVPRGSAAVWFNVGAEGAADLIDASAPVTNVRLDTV